LALIFGLAAFGLHWKDNKMKASQPEEQVKIFLRSLQKKTPEFFTDDIKNIVTAEIQKLQEKNPAVGETFARGRAESINALKQEISETIQRHWWGLAKTESDKEKIKQVEFLEKIAAEAYAKGEESEKFLSLLSELKDSGHFKTYYNADQKTSLEVLPSLIYENNKLTAAETPYDISLPQKDSPELEFNQKNKAAETRLILTLKNSHQDNLKVYDNQALYAEIKKGMDQLLITQADGLTNSFILKNPFSLRIEEDTGVLTLDYDLDAAKLTIVEDQGALILTDSSNLKQYVLTPPTLTDSDKQTPGAVEFHLTKNEDGDSQLRMEARINPAASFPLLINFRLLPTFTRYILKP